MKVSKKELYMLLMLLGVIIAFCAFWFGFRKINETTEALRIEAEAVEQEVKQYSAIKDNIDIYKQGIEDATTKIAEILAKIPSDVLPEDAFMLARELEKDNDYTFVTSVNWMDEMTIGSAISSPEDTTKTPITYYLNENEITISHTSSYQGVKDLINYVYNHKNRMAIETIMLTYDSETGLLAGNTIINFYSVSGSDKAYKAKNITNVGIGTDNIFGTIEVPEEVKDMVKEGLNQ